MLGNKAPKISGTEMMLRSMGLGEVLDMAKSLAAQGTLDKVLKFANDLDKLNATLARIEATLAATGPANGPALPGPSPENSGPFPPGPVGLEAECGPDRQPGDGSAASGFANRSNGNPYKPN